MANSELDFRREVLKSARLLQDVQALGINDRFTIGYPDVYIKYPKYPESFWLELKFCRSIEIRERVPLKLSALQRIFLKTHRRAGGCAGWAICDRVARPGYRTFWRVAVGTDPEATYVTTNDFIDSSVHATDPWEVWRWLEKIHVQTVERNIGTNR